MHAMRHLGVIATTLAVPLVLGAGGCAQGLPSEERIASTRTLAVQVRAIEDTPDPNLPPRTEAMPFERVELQ